MRAKLSEELVSDVEQLQQTLALLQAEKTDLLHEIDRLDQLKSST